MEGAPTALILSSGEARAPDEVPAPDEAPAPDQVTIIHRCQWPLYMGMQGALGPRAQPLVQMAQDGSCDINAYTFFVYHLELHFPGLITGGPGAPTLEEVGHRLGAAIVRATQPRPAFRTLRKMSTQDVRTWGKTFPGTSAAAQEKVLRESNHPLLLVAIEVWRHVRHKAGLSDVLYEDEEGFLRLLRILEMFEVR